MASFNKLYDYDKMVKWVMDEEGFEETDAEDWINYNTCYCLFKIRFSYYYAFIHIKI